MGYMNIDERRVIVFTYSPFLFNVFSVYYSWLIK
jgi:hypothetical protein